MNVNTRGEYEDLGHALIEAAWIEDNTDPEDHQDVIGPLLRGIDDWREDGHFDFEGVRKAIEDRVLSLTTKRRYVYV